MSFPLPTRPSSTGTQPEISSNPRPVPYPNANIQPAKTSSASIAKKPLPLPTGSVTATLSSPRKEETLYLEEIAKLKKELEEERRKSAGLEASLANSTKVIKQLQSELEYVKSKIATAVARKESATSSSDGVLRSSHSGTSSPSLHNSSSGIPNTSSGTNSPAPERSSSHHTLPDTRVSKSSAPRVLPTNLEPAPKPTINNVMASAQPERKASVVKKNTYKDPRLTQSITKINNIMTKIILDVISGDFDVASANTFDSIIDEISEICEPEFSKIKDPVEKKAMFSMLDDFEDTSMTFTKIAMKLRVDPDDEELLTKLDSKTKVLEELLEELGEVLFEKPEIENKQLERLSRLSRVQPARTSVVQPVHQSSQLARPPQQSQPVEALERENKSPSRRVGVVRQSVHTTDGASGTSTPPLGLSRSPSSLASSPTSPGQSGSFMLPALPSLPQQPGAHAEEQAVTRSRATEFSVTTMQPVESVPVQEDKILNRQSRQLARVSMKMLNTERHVQPEQKAEERRQSKIIRKSITNSNRTLSTTDPAHQSLDVRESRRRSHSKSAAQQQVADLTLITASLPSNRDPVTGKWVPRMGPNAQKRQSIAPNEITIEVQDEEHRVRRKSNILTAMSNQGLLSTRPQAQRHALVKPSVPVPVQSQEPVYSSSSEDDEDDDMDDDDEDLKAQREEFAALFGKSLKDLVKEKEDKKVFKQIEMVGTLVNKCTSFSQQGSHVSKFLCSSVARESGNLIVLLRSLGENNMKFYDLADDVEDLSEDFVDLSKKIYKLHYLKAGQIDHDPLLESQNNYHKLLKSIAEFKENDGKTSTANNRGRLHDH